MEKPKTIRQVKEFLNTLPDKFLDRTFFLQQENETHQIHFLDLSGEDLYYNEDFPEDGCMSISDWIDHDPDIVILNLKIGIPEGAPMIGEDF